MHKTKKTSLIITVFLFLTSAAFLVCGIYMTVYSVGYVRTYMETSAISPDNAFRYILESSAFYFGFAILLFASAMIFHSITRPPYEIHASAVSEEKKDDNDDTDAHPENNPYYSSVSRIPADDSFEAACSDNDNEDSNTNEIDETGKNDQTISSEMIKNILEKK